MDIKILYFDGCPSHGPVVALVRQMVATLGVAAEIEAIEIKNLEEAAARRFLGSPTVLVNDVDIDPSARGRTDYGFSCRLYSGVSGLPPQDMLAAALQA